MPVNLVVPQLGESVIEATVGHWRKSEGDFVEVGEVVLELETEKVNLEVGATQSGRLLRIERKEGETVKIGDVLAVIEEMAGPKAGAEQPLIVPKHPSPRRFLPKGSPRPRPEPVQDAQARRISSPAGDSFGTKVGARKRSRPASDPLCRRRRAHNAGRCRAAHHERRGYGRAGAATGDRGCGSAGFSRGGAPGRADPHVPPPPHHRHAAWWMLCAPPPW